MYSVTGFPGTMDRTCHPLPFRTLLCILIILVLALAAPVSAAVHTINPGDSIQTRINSSADGDTIILNPGIYTQHDIMVFRNITIRANTSSGHSAEDTIIDAEEKGRIFNNSWGNSLTIDNLALRNGDTSAHGGAIFVASGGTLTITSSTFSNCRAHYGGAIFSSYSTVAVTSSTFSNCWATSGGAIYAGGATTITSSFFSHCSAYYGDGGAIYADSGTTTITTSSFSNCSAEDPTPFGFTMGGAIYSKSATTLTITSSSFSYCSSTYDGGAIYASGTTAITSSTFSHCSAFYGDGGAIHAGGTATIHFSRIYQCNTGKAVYKYGVTVDAADNWWGTNSDPSGYTSGGVTVSPWLVHTLTATPSTINHAQTSAIRTNLTYLSNGTDTTSGGIFVPDGIPVAFALAGGTGSIAPQDGIVTSGANTTTFTPAGAGFSSVSATVDDQTVYSTIGVIHLVQTLNPGDSIQMAINISASGGTIILNPGTYSENGIKVNKNMTIRANTSYGHSAADTIIDGSGGSSGILTVDDGVTFAVDNLTLRNGHTSVIDGAGAIFSYNSTVTVTSSTFSNCSAVNGGAINAPFGGTFNVTSSTFSNCSAGDGGAIIASGALVTVTSSTFSNCSATDYGGAIYSYFSSFLITSSTFSNCSAEHGGAIYVYGGDVTMRFSRIYKNGLAVYMDDGTLNVTNNWWGSNLGPSVYIASGVYTIHPILVLNITATPPSITTAQTSTIRVNLTRNSDGIDTTSGGIFIPAGIPVAFALTSGTGSVLPQAGNITYGANTTTFTPAGAGTSTVSATVDGETVSTDIIVAGSSGTASMVGVFRPSIQKFILKNGTERTVVPWGLGTDTPVTGDWNGDGMGDVGVYRPSIQKFILKNGTERTVVQWGLGTDTPVTGDWNGDGMGDVGVYRPSIQKFILKNGTERTVIPWGLGTDIPVSGDWNGDGLSDVGVYRPSIQKFILKNGTERTVVQWGLETDIPVSGDWNGNGLGDVGVYRPSIQKFLLKNGTERTVVQWGLGTDTPVTGRWR